MQHLLIIDGQNDFCDVKGSLYVPGADKDMQRLANYIYDNKSKIKKITVSRDIHLVTHIANPIFWKNSNGDLPDPFTIITKEDVIEKKWIPLFYDKALDYVTKLEEVSPYKLIVWPEHCIVGSWGSSLYPILSEAILDWERSYYDVFYISKGQHIFTEQYSILKTEVPCEGSPEINSPLLNRLVDYETLVVGGEASSHCVASSMHDLVKLAPENFIKKIKLLKECMSPVTGYEDIQEELFNKFETI